MIFSLKITKKLLKKIMPRIKLINRICVSLIQFKRMTKTTIIKQMKMKYKILRKLFSLAKISIPILI